MKMHIMMSHIKVCSSIPYHILLAAFGELPIIWYVHKHTMGFLKWLVQRIPLSY